MAGIECEVFLESRQKMNGETENSKENYTGNLIERETKKYLSYKRKTEDGEIDCLLSFNRKGITISQKGQLNSKLELIPGQKTVNAYATPMGTLNLEVYTRRFELVESEGSIKIVIDYDIVLGGDAIQTNMDIRVKY